MKKKLKKIFMLLLIVGAIFGGKAVIDYKTFDYTDAVNTSLTSYFVSGNSKDLDPVIELLEKYKSDDKMREEIQQYSLDIVGSWFTYLDSKYYCDVFNLNSCKAQLSEFEVLNNKLNVLYNYKCDDGFTIIIPSSYTNLKVEGQKKVEGISDVINNPNAKNPQTSEEIRLKKCLVAVDCDNCRDGICQCFYIDENKNREEVSCKNNS